MAGLIRINKYLSEIGFCSRRKADFLIDSGLVLVNGKKITKGEKINPDNSQIYVDGKQVDQKKNEKIYYALYKPRGVVSTANDELGRKSVVDLLPKGLRVYPVGRLDKNSEGLIILTNDGELTNILTHPKGEHLKYYEVRVRVVNKSLSSEEIAEKFKKGLFIDGKKMFVDEIIITELSNSNNLFLSITLHTGYNRQIRKMCDKIGLEVLKLKRIKIAKLSLDELKLKPGEFKTISRKDIL